MIAGFREGLTLAAYRDAFPMIHGAFTVDAALLFFAYGELLAESGVSGSVLEIGVHQGLSAIAVAALRGPRGRVVAVDTFGASRDITASGGMSSDERTFRADLARFHDHLDLHVIAGDSRAVSAADLPRDLAFAHVDGGHSEEETFHDVALAAEASLAGGLVAVDDYFNPSFPGVSEGVVRYLLERPGELVPIAIGHNKVLLQRGPASGLNALFAERYPEVPRTRAVMSGAEVLVFGSPVTPFFDLDRSTPSRLVTREVALRVELLPRSPRAEVPAGKVLVLEVLVRNRSDIALGWSDAPFGLSYHLRGPMDRFENPRRWFIPPIEPGQERTETIFIGVPERTGDYEVEIDVVWEGIAWLRERGSAPARVALHVR